MPQKSLFQMPISGNSWWHLEPPREGVVEEEEEEEVLVVEVEKEEEEVVVEVKGMKMDPSQILWDLLNSMLF